mgnify:CR=1 FL=1
MFEVHKLSVLIENEPPLFVGVRHSRPSFPEVALIEKVSTETEDQLIDGHLGEGNLQVAKLCRSDGRVPVDDVLSAVTVHKDTSREAVLVPGDLQGIWVADFVCAEGGICRDHLDHCLWAFMRLVRRKT